MLDIRFIRENAEKVQESAKQKGYDVSITKLLELDDSRRGVQQQLDELREKRNANAAKMKGGKPDEATIEEGKQIKTELAEYEKQFESIDGEFQGLLSAVPNITLEDVPLGGEEDSVEIKKIGEQKTGAVDHLDFALKRDWVDFERGAKVAGAKFYFLKDELALLEQALIQYGINFVTQKGFRFLTVPHMVNSQTAEGAGFAPKGDASGNEYFVEDTNLTMIGTAEAPLTGYHAGEILNEDELPLLYAGLSPCYRKEAGTYGKHTRGLFRVHQFNKLEMYAFTLPEQSKEMHERILQLEEELWQSLGISYHVINIAAGDLGSPAAKKYDLEYWSPVDGTYRELTSCSNCTDFQARNLNIRVRRKDGTVEVVHTLNGTAISLARGLITILENYQNEDGTLNVPEALKPYFGGRERL
ncbi:MAG TPA: serine--tRNA ligase [Candidatus Saccharibacteria bacterium]|nr:serine--tRNA ligase [Candidatus Saccharibacteria bacterium]